MLSNPVVLQGVPFFQLMDKEELAELSVHLSEEGYFPGQVIFSQGDPGGTMHVILVGKVRTSIKAADGSTITLDELGPGEVFGELSLLDGHVRSAGAAALTDVR